jgi:glutamyl-tRNA synthetase
MVRTRFAPSPTGSLHLGGGRTALFAWLYARRFGGQFILRIEDTDLERSQEAHTTEILEALTWLELSWDEGPYYQSQRFDRYRTVIDKLLQEGHAYYCYCSKERLEALRESQLAAKQKPRYDGHCRHLTHPPAGVKPVVRFKTPLTGAVVVDDLIRGKVIFDNSELDDLVIARADGSPTYNFVVVVDDWDMQITHVIRGDDHLNNTPRQIHIFNALGAPLPQFAHVPMILGEDGKKLSKRHGAMSILEYRNLGYLPDALVNYLARLGWSHGDQEIFTREELVRYFDLAAVNRAPAMFNAKKLLWTNEQHLKLQDPQKVAKALLWHLEKLGVPVSSEPALPEVVMALRERAKTLVEMAEQTRPFYVEPEQFDEKAQKVLKSAPDTLLSDLISQLEHLPTWTKECIHETLQRLAAEKSLKLGDVAQPLRAALMGRTTSPPIDTTCVLLGKEKTIARLKKAQPMAAAGNMLK